MLKEGDKAPSFEMDTDEGRRVSLRDFADETLVLYFYPRDNTPGCTREAQAFTAARRAIETAGGAIVGVSRDSSKSHSTFREKCGLGITLASDPDLSVHKAYGAWGEKTMYGKKVEGVLRSTFLIRGGRIVRVFPSVKVDGHADEVLQAIGELTAGGPSSRRIPTMPPPKKETKANARPKAKAAPKAKPKSTRTAKAAPRAKSAPAKKKGAAKAPLSKKSGSKKVAARRT